MTTIIIFTIDKGKHYQVCNDIPQAVEKIKKNLNNFLCLLPYLNLDDNETSEGLIKKCQEAQKRGDCISKRRLTVLLSS